VEAGDSERLGNPDRENANLKWESLLQIRFHECSEMATPPPASLFIISSCAFKNHGISPSARSSQCAEPVLTPCTAVASPRNWLMDVKFISTIV
jgi:hypothetical protein